MHRVEAPITPLAMVVLDAEVTPFDNSATKVGVRRNEEVAGAEAGVKIAPRPTQIIPKSMAHASLLAHVVTAKFVDALPLYRQECLMTINLTGR